MVDALRREDPARWLPAALATLCSAVVTLGGGDPDPDALLESWGLLDPDEAADRNAEQSLANLRALSAKLSARHA